MDKIDGNIFYNYDSKVNKQKNKKTDKTNKKSSITKKANFEELLNIEDVTFEAQEQNKDRLEILLNQIGKQGERLKKSRSLEDLDTYKKLVKEYLSTIISLSETAESKYLWDKNKKEKIAKVHLQVINNELLELTRIFFLEQQNTLAIAAKIDKIEGLLIDLRS